jgi:hypothetical protein
MSSLSQRLGLKRPDTADGFSTVDISNNWGILDNYPGTYICTAGTRPVGWGAAHSGMQIWETDTSLMWRWNGSAFVRTRPTGLLGLSEITTDFSTALTSATAAITANVTVPVTNAGSTTKRIRISASWYSLENGTTSTLGASEVSLYRGSTALKVLLWRGRPFDSTDPQDNAGGGTIEAYDNPAAGAQTYTLRINSIASVGGTTVLKAAVTAPAHLAVEEVGL